MAAPIQIIRHELDAAGLRRAARRASSAASSQRMLALALILEGASRTEAAQSAGMDRQTLRDWVHRYNEEGLAGLVDRQGSVGPKRLLSPAQEAEVDAGAGSTSFARSKLGLAWCWLSVR